MTQTQNTHTASQHIEVLELDFLLITRFHLGIGSTVQFREPTFMSGLATSERLMYTLYGSAPPLRLHWAKATGV